MSNPFEYVNAINMSKDDIISNSDNPELAEKGYNSFMVNKALSYHIDTIHFANLMNANWSLDNKLQFDFLINIVRPRKRFSKWAKTEISEDIELISEYFQCNNERAIEYARILTQDELAIIKKQLQNIGGMK